MAGASGKKGVLFIKTGSREDREGNVCQGHERL